MLTTIPKGLYFPDGYTAGTKEEVTGIYSDSCCNADLQIIAVDRMNNRYVKQINAYSKFPNLNRLNDNMASLSKLRISGDIDVLLK